MPAPAEPHLRLVQPHARLDDPHRCDDDGSTVRLRRLLYDALVASDGQGGHVPALASAWSVDDAARRWRLLLRPGVLAHDGAPVDARDVIASLERARDPALGGALGTEGVVAGYLEGVQLRADVDADGVEVVTIATPRPFADLLDLLVDLPVVPQRAHGAFAHAPVGTGRYRAVSVAPGRLELRRWEGHWAATESPAADASCEPSDDVLVHATALSVTAEPDAAARVGAVVAGAADVASHVPSALARSHASDPRVRLERRAASVAVVAFFHLHPGRPSPVHDVRVRRALQHACDAEAMVRELCHGYAAPLAGPFPPPHLGVDPSLRPHPHDPAEARALLAEAGHGGGLELCIDVPERLPDEAPALAAMLQRQWAEVGVTLRVRRHADREAYARAVRDGRYADLCVFDSSPASSFRVLHEKLHSAVAGPWWQGFHDPEVDSAIDAGAAASDPVTRREHYRRAYRRVHDAVPWLFLYAPEALWLTARRD